ncbi:MAG: hypothetical protein D6718_09005 [Acidobacteria bacterium]|nr:MAG: hypothetical protein D6718_09005 [Acidobacteriota bacterium]
MPSPDAARALSPVLPGVADPVGGSRYLQRFERELLRLAPRPVSRREFDRAVGRARVLLLGEFHPLPSACVTACEAIESAVSRGRRVACGVEMVHAREQAALDAWSRGAIGEAELRRRLRYREEWGYPWSGPRRLLRRAREFGVPVFGLDIPPRGSVADLAWRDEVAARRIAEHLRALPAKALVIAIYGEAHLASAHLPAALARARPELQRPGAVVRVFHDTGLVDTGGVGRAGDLFVIERAGVRRRAPALARVYRRWAAEAAPAGEIDYALVAHELLATLAGGIGIDPRRHEVGPAEWLADRFPEVYGPEDAARARRRLGEEGIGRERAERMWRVAVAAGARAVPRAGVLLVGRPDLRGITVACGFYLAAAMRGEVRTAPGERRHWSGRVAAEALGYALAALADRGLPRPSLAGIDRWLRGAPPRVRETWSEVRPLLRALTFRAWPVEPRPAAATPVGARLAGAWLGGLLATAIERGRVTRSRMRRWLARPLRTERDGRELLVEAARFTCRGHRAVALAEANRRTGRR